MPDEPKPWVRRAGDRVRSNREDWGYRSLMWLRVCSFTLPALGFGTFAAVAGPNRLVGVAMVLAGIPGAVWILRRWHGKPKRF